jgi:hypothetical protein
MCGVTDIFSLVLIAKRFVLHIPAPINFVAFDFSFVDAINHSPSG